MNRRFLIGLLVLVAIVVGGGLVAAAAYQAGVVAGAAGGAPVAAPAYWYGFGYGWHPFGFGFGLVGFLGFVLFLVLVFALIRAIVWGGRGWGGRGWGPGAHDGSGGSMRGPWGEHAQATFDDWHRRAHEGPGGGSTAAPPASRT